MIEFKIDIESAVDLTNKDIEDVIYSNWPETITHFHGGTMRIIKTKSYYGLNIGDEVTTLYGNTYRIEYFAVMEFEHTEARMGEVVAVVNRKGFCPLAIRK